MKKCLKLLGVMLFVVVCTGIMFCACDREPAKPGVYTLQEAYDEGVINMRELKSIAYYHNPDNNTIGTFTPLSKKDIDISQDEVNGVIGEHYGLSQDEIKKSNYTYECLGIYNNAIAIRIKPDMDLQVVVTRVIEGISVSFSTYHECILLWVK